MEKNVTQIKRPSFNKRYYRTTLLEGFIPMSLIFASGFLMKYFLCGKDVSILRENNLALNVAILALCFTVFPIYCSIVKGKAMRFTEVLTDKTNVNELCDACNDYSKYVARITTYAFMLCACAFNIFGIIYKQYQIVYYSNMPDIVSKISLDIEMWNFVSVLMYLYLIVWVTVSLVRNAIDL